MLVPAPVPYRSRRGRIKRATAVRPPGVALTLVAAIYNENDGLLQLRFDRAINAAGLVGTAITVKDGSFDQCTWNGVSAVNIIDPQTIELTLIQGGSYVVDEVTLTAAAGNGIVAVNDGGTWAGATNVALPFP